MSYVQSILDTVNKNYPEQPEFIQAVTEVLNSIKFYVDTQEHFKQHALLERLVEPERVIMFSIPWVDDTGVIRVNRGWRVQFNSLLGPYKGGLRFHPQVSLGTLKFLGFEQIFKNALTGLALGGGKGGSDFDPKGKSDQEIMKFCQSFMIELSQHIGAYTDVPAGDIGVGAREIGYMFGQYKRLTQRFEGVLTGKSLLWGGSYARKEATGYGLVYFAEELLKDRDNESFKGKRVVISGSGNVALYALEKAQQLGAHVVALSDSDGYIYDEKGIDFKVLQQIKEVQRARIKDYVCHKPHAEYVAGKGIWNVACDIALPCATQNELTLHDAQTLVQHGCMLVAEGANMPTTIDACAYLHERGVYFAPGKAANAGGVAVSGLEMAQNSMRLSWNFEEVDHKLAGIMRNIYHSTQECAQAAGAGQNLIVGANLLAFKKIEQAYLEQGCV